MSKKNFKLRIKLTPPPPQSTPGDDAFAGTSDPATASSSGAAKLPSKAGRPPSKAAKQPSKATKQPSKVAKLPSKAAEQASKAAKLPSKAAKPASKARTPAELEANRLAQQKCRALDAKRRHPCNGCFMVLKTKATLRQHLRDVHDISSARLKEPYWQDILRGEEAEEDDEE